MKRSSCRRPLGKPVRVQWMRAGRLPVVHADRRPRSPTSKSVSTRTARSPRIRSTTTCPPCRTIARSARSSPVCRPWRLPTEKGCVRRLDSERHADPWVYDGVCDSDGTRPRHLPGRPAGLADRRRTPRSQHADAGAIPAEFPARTGRSAKQQRWPAPTPSSSASTTPTEERVIGVLKAVRDASGWETRSSPQPNPVSTGDCSRARPGRFGDVPLGNLLGVRLRDRRYSQHGRDQGREIHDRGGPRHRRQPDAVEAAGGGRSDDGDQPGAAGGSHVR